MENSAADPSGPPEADRGAKPREEFIAPGRMLTSPVNMPPRCREELVKIMASLADSQLASAAGLTDLINQGPSLSERMALARIVYEKIQTAESLLQIMATFGADTERYQRYHPWDARLARDAPLTACRREDDRRLAVFNFPLEGWTDGLVMHYLVGQVTLVQIEEYSHVCYAPLAEALRGMIPVENRHALLAREGVARELARGNRDAVQSSITYWWPRVTMNLGKMKSAKYRDLRAIGLRHRPNEALLKEWQTIMRAYMDRAHLSAPMDI